MDGRTWSSGGNSSLMCCGTSSSGKRRSRSLSGVKGIVCYGGEGTRVVEVSWFTVGLLISSRSEQTLERATALRPPQSAIGHGGNARQEGVGPLWVLLLGHSSPQAAIIELPAKD